MLIAHLDAVWRAVSLRWQQIAKPIHILYRQQESRKRNAGTRINYEFREWFDSSTEFEEMLEFNCKLAKQRNKSAYFD